MAPITKVAAFVMVAAASAAAALIPACKRPEPAESPPLPVAATAPALAAGQTSRLPRIDVHVHLSPFALARALALMDKWGIDGIVNLSGGSSRQLLTLQTEAAKQAKGRVAVFASVDFVRTVLGQRYYGRALAEQLAEAKRLGAVGLKISKGLGLGFPAADRKSLLTIDDPGLDPLFEKAGELGMPVAIHTGDPKAFWKPADEKNERWDELQAHPEWSFHGLAPTGKPWPSWAILYRSFERRVARHPKTVFIGVHFGNNPEDPDEVGRMLDEHPNLYIDTAARVPEIGRHDPEKMRRFFVKYQDRVIFGTDTGIGESQEEMMYGSTGALPPTVDDEQRFFTATWRYFETRDRAFESPTPIQGRWKISGVGLPEEVLRKIYFENAALLLKWKPGLAPAAP